MYDRKEDTYLVDFRDRKEQIDITPNCFNKAVMGDCEIDPDFKEQVRHHF